MKEMVWRSSWCVEMLIDDLNGIVRVRRRLFILQRVQNSLYVLLKTMPSPWVRCHMGDHDLHGRDVVSTCMDFIEADTASPEGKPYPGSM